MKNFIVISVMILPVTLCAQRPLNIDYKMRGYVYAGSPVVDEEAPGGFASSENLPKAISGSEIVNVNTLQLLIDTTQETIFANEYFGQKMYLYNHTGSVVALNASDSRLYVIAEAWLDGEWKAIEYLPSSWCGNSYHTVFLPAAQYWEFTIPKYNGKIKTMIRYRLTLKDGSYIYSNAVSASVNKKQLTEKEGHTRQGIMDPYDE